MRKITIALFPAALLASCSLMPKAPSDEQALEAVRTLVEQGTSVFSVPLVSGRAVASAKVGECQPADPQEGVRCKVLVATQEIPLMGSLSRTMTLRFSKQSGNWVAYMR